jgi:hypothetical protein
MRTATTVQAELRQVLQGSMGMGVKEAESSTGSVWAAGFRHVTAHSRLEHILKIMKLFISLIFKFLGGCGKLRISETTDTESADMGA